MEFYEPWLAQAEEHRKQTGRPLVSLCYAQSLDGSLTVQRGQPTALSGSESSHLTHQLRAAHQVILVGIGTVIADDPLLTVRLVEGDSPQPVILDSHLRLPLEARLLHQHPRRAWIATTPGADPQRRASLEASGARLLELPADRGGRVDLEALLDCLADLGINRLMVEGGAGVITSFLEQRLADQAILTISPVFLGGLNAVERSVALASDHQGSVVAPRLRNVGVKRMGEDLIVWGKMA